MVSLPPDTDNFRARTGVTDEDIAAYAESMNTGVPPPDDLIERMEAAM
ncbi:MAG: hypothetical protein PHW10_01195 [Candidatus Peribacteraceae bacterium]|nr:hypothetical protein [Candidatus Peribacteraceae bacterium]